MSSEELKIPDYSQHQANASNLDFLDDDAPQEPWKTALLKYTDKIIAKTLMATLIKAGFVDWLKTIYPKDAIKNAGGSTKDADLEAAQAIKDGGDVAYRWIHDNGNYRSGERTYKKIKDHFIKSVAEYQTL
ncbi:hypothetical protein [Aeromonas media]|uniref:hypothetical protein n=1 Tax=Aeromonas media TaxID=651 RepID=UPI003D234E67